MDVTFLINQKDHVTPEFHLLQAQDHIDYLPISDIMNQQDLRSLKELGFKVPLHGN